MRDDLRDDEADPSERCRLCGDPRAAHTKKAADWRDVPGCVGSYRSHTAGVAAMTWSVSIERDGELVVTFNSDSLGGRDLSPEDEALIETVARHLLSVLGITSLEPRIKNRTHE